MTSETRSTMHIPLDLDQTVLLLRSSRLARVAFTIDDEPSLVTAAVSMTHDGRMTLEVDDADARSHLDGSHVIVEVDGQFASTGARWTVVARGTAVACDDAPSAAGRRCGVAAAPWASPPPTAQRFTVVPTTVVGHLLTRGATDGWFAGVPAS